MGGEAVGKAGGLVGQAVGVRQVGTLEVSQGVIPSGTPWSQVGVGLRSQGPSPWGNEIAGP